MEIFTSFRSLVDALADDADSGATHAARGTDAADEAPPADPGAKGDADASRVVVVDLTALMMPHPVTPPQGAGGTAPQGAATPDGHGQHVWTAADLALLLRGGRGAMPGSGSGADGTPAAATAVADAEKGAGDLGDIVDLSGVEPVPTSGLSQNGQPSSEKADRITDAMVAQALAQRLLASAGGLRELVAELAGQAGANSKNKIDELLRESLLTPERTSGAMNPASRLVATLTAAVTAAAPASMATGDIGTPATASIELLSSETSDQIIQAIRLQVTRGGGEAQIRLEPRQFGDLTVSVHVDQGQVVARLSADTAVVREWLQANEHMLRQSLADQHLTLTRLEVSEPSAESRQRAPRDGNGQPSSDERPARRPRTPDTGETFDVVA
jgi:flagellar hook-length control protein FliK